MSDELEDEVVGQEETGEQADEVSEFLDDVQAESVIPDQATVITIQTSGGDTRYVPTDTSLTIRDLISKAGLMVGGQVEYWLNGTKLQSVDEIIPLGMKLTIVGSVKGG